MTRAAQKSLPFGKWSFRGKEVRRMGQKTERDKTERATGLGRRTRGDKEKWDQTGSPEIPDRGGRRQKSPGLPSGTL